jgi:hypothetical protein
VQPDSFELLIAWCWPCSVFCALWFLVLWHFATVQRDNVGIQVTNRANLADDFQARSSDELSLAKGDRVELIERDDEFGDGWFLGKHLVNGNSGLFPEGT